MIKEKTGASFNFEFLAGDLKQKLGVMILKFRIIQI